MANAGGRKGEPRFDDQVHLDRKNGLSKSETAMWLKLRGLKHLGNAPVDRLTIHGRDRLLEYDLSRAMWSTHATLEACGLILVHRDPIRRRNGTTAAGERAEPHRFELRDEGLHEDGLSTVITMLAEIRSRKSG